MIIYFLKEGEMMIEQYLSEHYEKGEPIFLSDLGLEGMTEENLRYHLKRMTDEGKICRFAPGIYYFPKTNLLGEKQILSPETVALHKYIRRKGKRVGFYWDIPLQTVWDCQHRFHSKKKSQATMHRHRYAKSKSKIEHTSSGVRRQK